MTVLVALLLRGMTLHFRQSLLKEAVLEDQMELELMTMAEMAVLEVDQEAHQVILSLEVLAL